MQHVELSITRQLCASVCETFAHGYVKVVLAILQTEKGEY